MARTGRRGAAGAAAAAVVLAAACSARPASTPPPPESRVEPLVLTRPVAPRDGSFPVAAIFPAAGRYALSGIQSLNGARLAMEDVDREGGGRGPRLSLLEYRTGSYFLDARQAATLAADAGAVAIVGSNSSDLSMAIAEQAETRGVVQISNVSTAQDLTWDPETGRNRDFVFRMCATDVAMGGLLATFARETLGARRAAILYEVGRAYSSLMARSFAESFRDPHEGRAVAEFFYLALETDFRDQLRAVERFAPDVLFVPGSFTDASLIASQAESLGLRATLLGADGWSSPLLFSRGAPPGPAYFVDLCSPPEVFSARYERAFGQPPQGCRAALAYDAVRAVAAGLDRIGVATPSGSDLSTVRRRLRDALGSVRFSGVTGRVRFDPVGDRRVGVAVEEVLPRRGEAPVIRLHSWVGAR